MAALAMIEIDDAPALSLSLPKGMTFDEWESLGRRLCAGQRVVNWWIGDWWAAGHHRYGERARAAAADLFGREFGSLMNLASVCRSFETSRRREHLSWSHHVEVAALPPAEADRLLDDAAASDWSTRELRKQVTAYHQSRAGNDNKRIPDIVDIHADDDAALCLDFYTVDEIVIELATALGKHEPLSRRHSAFLERSVRRMQQSFGRQTEPWGGEADLQLVTSLQVGMKVERIAKMMERTPGAIRRRIYKLGGIAKIVEQGSVALIAAAE